MYNKTNSEKRENKFEKIFGKAVLTLAMMLMSTAGAWAQLNWSGEHILTDGQTITQNITLSGDVIIEVTDGTATISGGIGSSGSYSLTKRGAGTLVLTGVNTYSGATYVEADTLQVGNGTLTYPTINSTSGVTVSAGAVLYFRTGGTVTFSKDINGPGHVYYKGNNPFYVTGTWSHTGGTVIDGLLYIGSNTANSTTGSITGDIHLNPLLSTLCFSRSDDYTYSGIISGNNGGYVNKDQNGTLTLTGDHPTNARLNLRAGALNISGSWVGTFNADAGTVITVTGPVFINGPTTLSTCTINMDLTASNPSRLILYSLNRVIYTVITLNLTATHAVTDYLLIQANSGVTTTELYNVTGMDGTLSVISPNQLLFTGTVPSSIEATYNGLLRLTVGGAANGSINYTLSNGIYANPITATDFNVSNLPPGLTAGTAVRTNDTVVTLPITGTPTTYNPSSTTITLPQTVGAANVTNALNPVTVAGTVTLGPIAKGNGADVSIPAVSGMPTENSITVTSVTLTPSTTEQSAEYAINQSDTAEPENWQVNTTFSGLMPETVYYVWARSAENANYDAGTAQHSEGITTAKATVPPAITTNTLPNGTVDIAYSQTLAATGDTPVTWSVTGSLPTGLTLSTAGVISGTPIAAGTFPFTVQAENIAGSDTKTLTIIIIKGTPTYTVPAGLTAVYGNLLSSVTLPAGWSWENPSNVVDNVGMQIYPATFTPDDITNYNVVTGIKLEVLVDKAAGANVSAPVVSGTPTQTGITVLPVTLTPNTTEQVAEYAINQSATEIPVSGWGSSTTFNGLTPATTYYVWARSAENDNYYAGAEEHSAAITTADADVPPVITTDTLPNGKVGVEYSATLTATGTQPITWSVVEGNLPEGLTLSPEGIISGMPTAAVASISFKVRATNDVGFDEKVFTMVIYPENDINEPHFENPLKVWVNNSHIYIKGLTIGKTVSIYTVAGALFYQSIATSDEEAIPLIARGVYIVNQGRYAIKVVY